LCAIRLEGVKIGGITACVPSEKINNREFGLELYGDDLDGTLKVLGVEERRVCPEGRVTSLDLCVRAAETLRGEIGDGYSSFGGLVCVTQTPDLPLPNNSTYAHALLGFPEGAPAFDITLACSGYPYGLWVSGMMAASIGRKILLLDGDTHSHFVSSKDRATALLFGDAGTATIIEPDESAGAWYFDFINDGNMRDAIAIQDGGYRNRVTEGSAIYEKQPDGAVRRAIDMKMNGMSVFNAVVKYAPGSLKRVLDDSGIPAEGHDFLVLHQANMMMIKQVAKKLGFNDGRFPTSMRKYGNVSSASIPLTVCSELGDVVRAKKSRILMSAFGAGFSVGSASISLGPCPCPPIAEYDCR
jgi:3-oxoacyl-[acyl-carrier-protein] synthase-3